MTERAATAPQGGARQSAAEHIDVTRLRVARRSRVRELIFGAQDGLLTTLGLVSGVGGASRDRYTVLVAGLAGAFAGMIAMGAGAYISSKSQLEVEEAEVERERDEIERNPERELEELVHLFEEEGLPTGEARMVAQTIAKRPVAMLNAMREKELRVQPEAFDPFGEGLIMAFAFLIGAVVPITPWFVASTAGIASVVGLTLTPAFLLSAGATIAVLFLIGAGKSRLAHSNVFIGGLEVMGVGVAAALVGFVLGNIFPHLVGAKAVAG